ncbi:unnamed protein product [Prunus brigantina]
MVLLFQLSCQHRIVIGMWPLTILSTRLGVAWFLHQENMLGVVIGFSVVSDSFIGARDHKRVLDMEPWVYWRSLILLAEILDNGSMHSMPLAHGTIWVQFHSVIQTYGAKTYWHYGMPLLGTFLFLHKQGRTHSGVNGNNDSVSSPTLTRYHQVLEAIESLRIQTGLSEDGVRSPPPPPLSSFPCNFGCSFCLTSGRHDS